jgi:putative DNA primase/helicase
MTKKTQEIVAAVRNEIDDARPPEFSDDALALRFAERHSGDRRYVERWKTWMCWDGVRWQRDETLHAYDQARKVCRLAASQCNDARLNKAIASAATVSAVEKLARADRKLAATAMQWDRCEWLLNTPEGVWDLRTGAISPPRRELYLTKLTSVSAGGSCPTWLDFLHQITDGDLELQSYLQRIAGYCLTGSVREHAIFFLHGSGANGKSTFVDTF